MVAVQSRVEDFGRVCVSESGTVMTSSSVLCDICQAQQERLLEDGDGSQVICDHSAHSSDTDDGVGDNTAAVSSTETTSSSRKRKFLSREEFYQKADDKSKRRIAPIRKWRELVVGDVYRVSKIHDIDVNIKGKEQLSHYGEFEDAKGSVINVWLTEIIYTELNKYKLEEKNVYIKPLGKRKSMKSGMEYHDFVVVVDDE